MEIHHGYAPWNKDGATATKFGHADYHEALAQGKSASEIANWAKSNADKMGNKGVGGDLWNTIMSAENKSKKNNRGGGGGGGAAPQPPAIIDEIDEPEEVFTKPDDNEPAPKKPEFVAPADDIYNDNSQRDPQQYLKNYIVDLKKGLAERARSPETSVRGTTSISQNNNQVRPDNPERTSSPYAEAYTADKYLGLR